MLLRSCAIFTEDTTVSNGIEKYTSSLNEFHYAGNRFPFMEEAIVGIMAENMKRELMTKIMLCIGAQ